MKLAKMLLTTMTLTAVTAQVVAQGMTIVPSNRVKERREDYRLAEEAWRTVSQNLEKEFLRVDPAAAMARINRAAEKAAQKVAARDAYNQAVLEQIRGQITLLAPVHAMPTEALKEAVSRQLEGIKAAKESLGSQLLKEDGGPQRTLLNEKTRQQLHSLEGLERNMQQQQDAASRLDTTGASLEQSRNAILGNYQQLLGMTTAQADRDKEETALWEAYYAALRQAVEERQKKMQGKTVGNAKKDATAKPKR